ncbi:MAG TPA: carboxylate-amine ligase [Ktedonobacteraceae bacterium]|jgi:carboxylate-amine ligase
MNSQFTLGVEEEFQMVDRNTGQLVSHIHTILGKGAPILGDFIKAETPQCSVELNTHICPNITALHLDLQQKQNMLARLLEEDGLTFIRAGTHPTSHWHDQRHTHMQRYDDLIEELQDAARSSIVFGLHIHVGIQRHEIAIPLMNQLRTWLPHLLALSSNSPFWMGRNSGIKSYRSIVRKSYPRTGIPNPFASTAEFDHYVADLVNSGCIDNAKKIWWDIRPHPFFDTIEFRICDMPATIEDSIALAALCQALVAKLTWLHKRNMQTHVFPSHYIEENKWRAARYGLDAQIIDFGQQRSLSMRDSINELLDFVDDVLDDLDTRHEIHYLRALLEDSRGTGADRQLAVYRETNNANAVTDYLLQTAMEGIALDPVL